MGKGYLIENYEVINHQEYIPPVKAINEILEKFNGKFLVATPKATAFSGTPLEVIVVIEFDSDDNVLGFYHSSDYEVYKKLYERTTSGWVLHSSEYKRNN